MGWHRRTRGGGEARGSPLSIARRDARRGEWAGFAGPEGAGKPPVDQRDARRDEWAGIAGPEGAGKRGEAPLSIARRDAGRGEWAGFAGPEGAGKPPVDRATRRGEG